MPPRRRVLIVEDSPTQAAEFVFILEDAGFEAEVAADGKRGLERVRSTRFDLVLADVLMPGMSGFEMCRAIKESPETRKVPVVFLTTLNDIVDIVRGLASGADGYLNKPCEPEDLVAAVAETIDRKRRRDKGEPSEWYEIAFAGQKFNLLGDSRQVSDYLLSVIHHFGITLERIGRQTAAEHGAVETEALRRSEERFALALTGSNDGLWDWELKSNRIFFSPRWVEIAGCKEDELGSSVEAWFTRVHPDDLERLQGAIQAHVEGALNQFECEHRLRCEDGTYRWVLVRGRSVRDADGKAYRVAGSLTDISEHKTIERNLLDAQAEYRDLVEDLNEIVYAIDISGVITYISRAVEDVSGYKPAELIGTKFTRLIVIEDLPAAIEGFRQHVSGNPIPSEYRVVIKSGEVRWIRTGGRPIKRDGQTIGLRGVLTDITEHKRLETTLKRRSEIENLIISISVGLLELAPEDIDAGIARALESIARFGAADRCIMYVPSTDGQAYRVVHEWRAAGIDSPAPAVLDPRDFPWLAEGYQAFRAVSLSHPADLHPEDHVVEGILTSTGLRSFAAVPMALGRNRPVGILGLAHQSERTWSDEIIGLLTLVAPAMAATLERREIFIRQSRGS